MLREYHYNNYKKILNAVLGFWYHLNTFSDICPKSERTGDVAHRYAAPRVGLLHVQPVVADGRRPRPPAAAARRPLDAATLSGKTPQRIRPPPHKVRARQRLLRHQLFCPAASESSHFIVQGSRNGTSLQGPRSPQRRRRKLSSHPDHFQV